MPASETMKHDQTRLARLGAYPFERLRELFAGLTPNPSLEPINAGVGEPHLPLPDFAARVLADHMDGFSRYPSTTGSPALRESIAGWLMRRYGLSSVDSRTQVLAANGTREALFTVAHALVNPEAAEKPYVMMPNPMYQIYLGAAITAGAEPWLLSCSPEHGFAPMLDDVPESVWQRTALVYVCSPSNPTGWVADTSYYGRLLELADRHGFYVLADECYSEIYREKPPVGLLEVAERLGRPGFSRCLVFNSLSKRSAMPGLRSGLIAGDAALIKRFAKLRSYTGPATPLPLQHVAMAAWDDDAHVEYHLAVHQRSLQAFFEALGEGEVPAGSFFVWLPVGDDEAFARRVFTEQAVTVLPGRYLGAEDGDGYNPGAGYVRLAIVDGPEKAVELAGRLRAVKESA